VDFGPWPTGFVYVAAIVGKNVALICELP
jgi:hypothetical protein